MLSKFLLACAPEAGSVKGMIELVLGVAVTPWVVRQARLLRMYGKPARGVLHQDPSIGQSVVIKSSSCGNRLELRDFLFFLKPNSSLFLEIRIILSLGNPFSLF